MNKLLSTYALPANHFTKDIAPSEMFAERSASRCAAVLKAAIEGEPPLWLPRFRQRQNLPVARLEEDLPQGRYRIHTPITPPSIAATSIASFRSHGTGTAFQLRRASRQRQPAYPGTASHHKLRVIVMLDEAHLLSIQVLEQLHILLNYEKDSKPWLSLILVGLPDLRETLKRMSWRP